MFKKLYEKVKNEAVNVKPEYINVLSSEYFDPDKLTTDIANCDTLDDKYLYDIIYKNIDSIFSHLFDERNVIYIKAFTNTKFLNLFIQVISSMQNQISLSLRINCNRLAYDLITNPDMGEDKYRKQLMLTLSNIVNKQDVQSLIGIGLPQDLACYLALCRKSSTKEITNVKRLNYTLIISPKEIMTEQNIVYIYQILFDRMTELFEGIMFDNYTTGFNDDMKEIYSRISLAILDLVENMPFDMIIRLLKVYSQDYKMVYSQYVPRFNILAIAVDDFPRICKACDELYKQCIYMP